tara:strand:- start:72324 stop:73376 length:1053 start_codon:yes stop_codon:yes gene_type:complete
MNMERATIKPKIAVVIPCFRVRNQILSVLAAIGPEISAIYVIDDQCPDQSGNLVLQESRDPRVKVSIHKENKGVGGAVMTGYQAALSDGADIVVKVDGDGQMDPSLIADLIHPIVTGRADYTKGNRFYSIYYVRDMPRMRLLGNAALSFMTKISSGYWSIFDPTNGFTAIHRTALSRLELRNISERYFFESDMLINLGNIRAVVSDVPMEARYEEEESNLKIRDVVGQFFTSNIRETTKRVLYNYFMRDFSLASAQLAIGILFLLFGVLFGTYNWYLSMSMGDTATTGTVMIATLPIILGFQLVLAFLGFDMGNEPKTVLHEPRRRRADHLDSGIAGAASNEVANRVIHQ